MKHTFKSNKNLVIIDDDLSSRFVLKKLIYEHFLPSGLTFNILSTSSSVEGLGLMYSVFCDVVIIDHRLPPYEGKTIFEYIGTNQKIQKSHTKIIVLYKGKKPDIKGNYIFINKGQHDYLRQVLQEVTSVINPSGVGEIKSYESKLRSIGELVLKFGDRSNRQFREFRETQLSRKPGVKVKSIIGWIYNQIATSIFLTLFSMIGSRIDPDANEYQNRFDKTRIQKIYYPSIALGIMMFALVSTQVIAASGVAIAFFNFNPGEVSAATKTWDGGGADNNWSTCANWDLNTCPVAADLVVFNSTSTKNVNIDAGFAGTISSVSINSGYTGVITQQRSLTVTSTFTQSAGTYTAGSQALSVTGAFTINSGANFTSSSTNNTFGGNYSVNSGSTFSLNGGPVTFSGSTITLGCNNIAFNTVTFSTPGSGTKTINADCTVPFGNNPTFNSIDISGTVTGTGTLTLTTFVQRAGSAISGFTALSVSGTSTVSGTLNLSSYTSVSLGGLVLPFGGNFTIPTVGMTMSSSLNINAGATANLTNGPLTFTGSTFFLTCNNVTFGTVTFTNPNSGTKTINAGCSVPLGNNPTFSTVDLYGTITGTGTLTINTLTHRAGASITGFSAFANSTTLTVNGTWDTSSYTSLSVGNFTVASGANFTVATAGMTVAGNYTINSGSTYTIGSANITFTGTSITLACNNVGFNTVTFSSPNTGTKTINADCNVPLGASPTFSTIDLYGTITGTGTLTVATLTLRSTAVTTGFTGITNTTAITVINTWNISSYSPATFGNFTLSTGGVFTAASGGITINGNLTISGGTFNHNNSTVTFSGGSATLSCNSVTFNLVSFTGQTDVKTVNSNCTLPLGNNPVIPNGISLSGVLQGTGTVTFQSGTLTLNGTNGLSGFNSISANAVTAAAGSTTDLSSYGGTSSITTMTVSGGSFTAPSAGITLGSYAQTNGTFLASSGTTTVTGTFNRTAGVFSHNSGTLQFSGGTATITCTSATFNLVSFSGQSGVKTVSTNCTLPLGNNPTIPNGITLTGTLSGTGTLTHAAGTLTLNTGAILSGFSALTGTTNSLNISGATIDMSSYSGITVGGDYTISSGTFTASSGTTIIRGNLNRSGGTFNHGNGTVNLTTSNTTQTITGSFSFNNLTKTITTATPQTLTFQNGVSQTVAGTLQLNGYDTSNRLSLRSSVNGSQWQINPSGSRNMLYLDVRDGNNTNVTSVQMGGTGSVDSGNNTNFNFGSLAPNTPTTLGPASKVDGTLGTDTTPTLTFTLTDSNGLDTVRYKIEISQVANFSTLVVDYTSALAAQGARVFIVGQDPGTGTYTVGNIGQTLGSGNYYWRVMAIDNNSLNSAYATANSGNIAFSIDITPPNAFTPTLNTPATTNNTTPQVTFSTTDNIAVSYYQVKVDNGSFSTQTSPYTLPALSEGAHTITVRAYDTMGNLRDGTVNVTIDFSYPNPFTPTLNVGAITNNPTPILTFSTTDLDGIDRYEVKIDNGAFAVQTSPYTLPTLNDGAHTITVRAYDLLGNFRDGSVINVSIDTVLPATFTPGLNVASPTTNTTPQLTFSTTDNVAIDRYEVQIDNGNFTIQTSPYTLPSLNSGLHVFTVAAIDTAGNVRTGSVSLRVDLEQPSLIIIAPTKLQNSSITDTTVQVSDPGGIDVNSVSATGGVLNCTQLNVSQITCTVAISTSGDLSVTATDISNNSITTNSNGYVIDPVAPQISILAPTKQANNLIADTTIAVTDNYAISAADVSVTGGTAMCIQQSTASVSCEVSITSSGDLQIQALDTVGNPASASESGYVVTQTITLPNEFTPAVNTPPITNNSSPIITFRSENAVSYAVRINNGEFINATSPYQLSNLAEGFNAITIRAYNAQSQYRDAVINITIDKTPPTNLSAEFDITSPTNNPTPTINFNAIDTTGGNQAGQITNPVERYELKLNTQSQFTPVTSPYQFSPLPSGNYTLTIRAYDAAGNFTEMELPFVVDTDAPSGTIEINQAAESTLTTKVKLKLTVQDNHSTDSSNQDMVMLISEDPDFNGVAAIKFSNQVEFFLSNGYGTKTVYARFIDAANNPSETVSDRIDYLSDIPVATPELPSIINTVVTAIVTELPKSTPVAIATTTTATVATAIISYPKVLAYGVLILRRRYRYKKAGIIYDADTKSPVPLATVRIMDSKQHLLQQVVTDFGGKYGFILTKGNYIWEISHSDFVTTSGEFEFEDREGLFGIDVALTKSQSKSAKSNIFRFITRHNSQINRILVIVGLIVSILAFTITPNLVNLLIVSAYILQSVILFVVTFKPGRDWGIVTDERGNRIKGVILRATSAQDVSHTDVVITDAMGRYNFNLTPGEYLVTVSTPGYMLSDQTKRIETSAGGAKFVKLNVKSRTKPNLGIILTRLQSGGFGS